MAAIIRKKFSSQAAPEVLAALRRIAESEGRPFQVVLDEALRGYIERHGTGQPRPHVADAFGRSIREFDGLYTELAK